MEIPTWIGALAGIGAAVGGLATAVTAVVLAVQLRVRERRQALVDLNDSLTSGETARARNVVGTILYGQEGRRIARRDLPAWKQSGIESYFALIWAAQRARNTLRLQGVRWETVADGGMNSKLKIHVEAQKALTWNLSEIAVNIVEFRRRYREDWMIEDNDAWRDIGPYVGAEPTQSGSANINGDGKS